MANKLDLTFSTAAPESEATLICLVGSKNEIIPTLDKSLAAAIISAMSLAQFSGENGKSLTLFLETTAVVLVGVGKSLSKGRDAEALGGVIFKALDGLSHKHACFPAHDIDDEIMADILLGMRSAAYHFDEYFTDTDDQNKTVSLTVVSSSLTEQHAAVSDRMALMAGVEMAFLNC